MGIKFFWIYFLELLEGESFDKKGVVLSTMGRVAIPLSSCFKFISRGYQKNHED